MVIHTVEKTVAERKSITLDANGLCPSGVTVSSVAASATLRSSGATDNTVLVSTSPTPSSNAVTIILYQGADGSSYLVKVAFTLSNSDVKEVFLILNVLNVT